MLTIGVDAHKHIHVALALDEAATVLGQWQGPNSPDGWSSLRHWAVTLGGQCQYQCQCQCQWGIEGAWNYGRGLAQYLVSAGEAGETIYEINPRWTAQRRGRSRKPGKSDRLDAYAAAQLVREEASELPRVTSDDPSSVLDLLVREREDTLAEATRLCNQLHKLLLLLDPEYKQHLPGLRTRLGLQALADYTTDTIGTTGTTSELDHQRAASVQRLGARLRLALGDATSLAKQIRSLARAHYSPLTEICGVELLTAGALVGILGPGQRFANEAQLALHAGVAPLEVSSAGRVRHRLNRGGNRRLNSILYRMAVTQSRHSAEAQRYLARRQAEGKTGREARRALKRYLVRAVWRAWQKCLQPSMSSAGSALMVAEGEPVAEEVTQVA
jgi:transposase